MKLLRAVPLLLLPLVVVAASDDSVPNAGVAYDKTASNQPTVSDPVGVIDGVVFSSATDLRVVCPGVDLVLKRAYASSSTRTGALGIGWSHCLDWRLVSEGTNLVLYAQADPSVSGTGETHRFAPPSAGGTSVSSAGGFLLRDAGGVREIQTSQAVLCRFDALGFLVRLETPGGVGVSLARDASGRLLRAVHDCGRALAFAYDDEGFLVSVVTDDSAVRVDYSYDDVSGAYPRTVLARAVRSDHAQASTNLYTWCPSPLAGLMNSPGSGIAGLQALSLRLGAGLDDLHFKTERAERALERGTTAEIIAATGDLRRTVDRLELLVDDGKWPLPKYRDMLFIY